MEPDDTPPCSTHGSRASRIADGGRALLRRLEKMSHPVTGGGRDSTPYTCWTAPSFTAHHGMCVSAACVFADATLLVEGARRQRQSHVG